MPLAPDRFEVPRSLWVERVQLRDEPAPYYVCWRPHLSTFAEDAKAVLRFARWPASTPTGAALRQWLNAEPAPAVEEPNDNTRTII